MALEDFEKELAKEKEEGLKRKRERSRSPEDDRERRKHSHRHRHHYSSKHREEDEHKHKSHHRHSRDHDHDEKRHSHDRKHRKDRASYSHHPRDRSAEDDENSVEEPTVKEVDVPPPTEQTLDAQLNEPAQHKPKRDSWMEAPSALSIDYVQRQRARSPPSKYVKASNADTRSKLHQKEVNHQMEDLEQEERESEQAEALPTQHEVDYTFGDAGSKWRMSKLQGIYQQAKESGKSAEEVALSHYGNLRTFDDAREEELELDRRRTIGQGYIGKEKPSGDLYQERRLDRGIRRPSNSAKDDEGDGESDDEFEQAISKDVKERTAPNKTVPLDQTALNKLKAQMMKAKLMKAPNAEQLEAGYNEAMASAANSRQNDVVVLNKMESRMLTGGREGEVSNIDNKRGRERGLVEENEDMSIEDMVRQERRTKSQFSDQGKSFAERIAKDGKFDNDMDYLDENAAKLAKSAPKTDVSLRNTAINDYQKMKRILDTCPLCHHEDTETPPQAPIVSLATRTFLTLPTTPEITPYGFCASIVPTQHRLNLLECDDDEWEEIRNFMKSLTKFYWSMSPRRSVVFYENAAHDGRKRHASMEAVPLPAKYANNLPAFFKESILAADEEWTQHRKVIDTLANATDKGMGKLAFRRSMVAELPYFHVWFSLDGGLGHVVEDARRWPKGDLFAREIIGGMLDVGPEVMRKQGRWKKGDPEMESRVKKFSKGWQKWDWTSALMENQ
ncbi:MAG: hypothetical protein M1831_005859 [Alyxoria varia]|nr:MAG: hypothetical protein M1831_005859 [Alyxoria varia]